MYVDHANSSNTHTRVYIINVCLKINLVNMLCADIRMVVRCMYTHTVVCVCVHTHTHTHIHFCMHPLGRLCVPENCRSKNRWSFVSRNLPTLFQHVIARWACCSSNNSSTVILIETTESKSCFRFLQKYSNALSECTDVSLLAPKTLIVKVLAHCRVPLTPPIYVFILAVANVCCCCCCCCCC